MEKRQVSLQDKYILEEGRAFMTGIQALVRLPMVQRRLDQSRGWDTGGFISGYRGSPLGALDQQLVLNRKLLEEHHVRFNPGVNEDPGGNVDLGNPASRVPWAGTLRWSFRPLVW